MTMDEHSNLNILDDSQKELERIFKAIEKQASKSYDKSIIWKSIQPLKNKNNIIVYLFSSIVYLLSFGKINLYINYRYYKRDILVFNTLKKYGFKVKNKGRDFKISW